jgi:hypothetical protein
MGQWRLGVSIRGYKYVKGTQGLQMRGILLLFIEQTAIMKKLLILTTVIVVSMTVHAQLDVAKLIGKNSKDFKLGFGAFIKGAFPLSDEMSDLTAEIGVKFFFYNDGSGDGMAYCPLKLGYRRLLRDDHTGFYLEPQAGYNVYGVASDERFNGFVWSAGGGYLFAPSGRIQFDIGLRYESVVYKGSSVNSVGLRITHNFMFGRRE